MSNPDTRFCFQDVDILFVVAWRARRFNNQKSPKKNTKIKKCTRNMVTVSLSFPTQRYTPHVDNSTLEYVLNFAREKLSLGT